MLLLSALNPRVHSVWKLERSQFYWEVDCSPQRMDEETFKANFRMSRSTFWQLCDLLPCLRREDTVLRAAIPLYKRIAIAIYALASSAEYRTVANLFGVGKSTVCELLLEFCTEVWEKLSPIYMKNPLTDVNIRESIKGFNEMGFPQCLGAIDGCHIAVHPNSADATDYHNYKGWYSMVLLALVDYRYRFMYINVGSPGRCSDSQIFENSALKRQLLQCSLLEQNSKELSNVQIPVMLIGDSAFKLSNIMMKPYPYSISQSTEQKLFNYSLSKCRRVVENAFGQLKSRFRRIGKGIDNSIENAPLIVQACCVLHNFLNESNDHINATWLNENDSSQISQNQPMQRSIVFDGDGNAVEIRNAISRYLSAEERYSDEL